MRRKITMLFVALLACVGVAKADVNSELQGKYLEIGPAVTEVTTGNWYILNNVGRGNYVSEETTAMKMRATSNVANGSLASDKAGYLFKITAAETEGQYYIQSGNGLYFSLGQNSSTISNDPVAYEISLIGESSDNFCLFDVANKYAADGQESGYNFVGWSTSKPANAGGNDSYRLIPVSFVEKYNATINYMYNGSIVCTESLQVLSNTAIEITAPVFRTITSCTASAGSVQNNGNGTYSYTVANDDVTITVGVTEEDIDLTQTYRLKNVASGLYMTVVEANKVEKAQIKALDESAEQTFTLEATQTKSGYKFKSSKNHYLTASSAWDYSATDTEAAGSVHIIEAVGEGKYRLKSINGYVGSNQDAFTDGSPMYSNHPASRNTIEWEFESAGASIDQMLKEEMATLKSEAETALSELSGVVKTAPLSDVISTLTAAIAAAESNEGSTDVNVLNAAIDGLKAAIALNKNLTFHGGALASLEDGEYVIYYEDANGNKRYLVNDKASKRVVTSSSAAVYDITLGNVNGHTSYAYYLDMNGSKISNPTDDNEKRIQVENKDGYNYGLNRPWDSQVLYVNTDGKYAIRSTNCEAGSGWNSDCFIKVSEDGVTVTGQNTELSDALYMWNVVKASEAGIVHNLSIDKYNTLFLNYAVKVPVGVTAYTVTGVEDQKLALESVGNVIPENTPVIIEGAESNYAFIYTSPVDAYSGENLLKGSWLDSDITPTTGKDAYVMIQKDGEVVMANGGSTPFLNRANEAYLEIAQEEAKEFFYIKEKKIYALTFVVDNEIYRVDSLSYGEAIVIPEAPVKEGHTFSGWSEAPETMPAADVTISGTFTTNEYLVTFKIGEEVIAADSLEYGATIVAPEAPEKEGYTFDGWGEVAETVPAGDVIYEGSYSVNSYLLTYTVDRDTIQTDSVAYGTVIALIEEPVKEGHTFSGWSEAPETMPAGDVTISGTFAINEYLVTFKISDEVIAADSLEYGAAIVAPEAPEKEGYTFDGWGEVAETMPAGDVTYEGSYSVNSYLLTYTVDGDTLQTDSVAYGTVIALIEAPVKEGYTFSGWSEAPETMPADDVTIIGTFNTNEYLVTFKIGEEIIAADSLEYGAAIVAPEAPEKEGYTFDGWGEVAETVPAGDVTYEGSYSVNSYLLTYTVDGDTIQADSVAYGTVIALIEEPVKEGYTFSGWSEAPETMPAHDVTISGTFLEEIKKFLVTFKIGEEIIAADSLEYGAAIVIPEAPEKEGYTFDGWGEVAETMPAGDVTYEGSYSVNSYLLTYTVDGDTIQADSVAYGTVIALIEAPVKEGYTFSGWSEAPETMPAGDVTISGTFTINEYLVTFKIGDEVIAADSLEYGATIVAPEAPEKEGYTFDGWGEVAETVPAGDVTYEGSYSVNSYLLTYTVDGDTIQADSVAYGTVIALIEEPVKEGHTFSGWSEAPETMPAGDVTISGTFTINEYLVTFKIGDEVIAADSLEYGTAIVAPEAPVKEGYTFDGWGEVAETMPAGDVTYEGSYTVNIYKVYYYVGDELVHTEEVAYGEAIPEYVYEPTIEGDVFMGWVGETYDTMPAHDVTYTANIESGIDQSTIDNSQLTIYDLNGRRVVNIEHIKGGIYIVNGKKVMIK